MIKVACEKLKRQMAAPSVLVPQRTKAKKERKILKNEIYDKKTQDTTQ